MRLEVVVRHASFTSGDRIAVIITFKHDVIHELELQDMFKNTFLRFFQNPKHDFLRFLSVMSKRR